MNSFILYRVVRVELGHTFKAVWEIFSLGPVPCTPGLYLPTHLETIGKPQQILHQWSSLLPLLFFAILHSASDQGGTPALPLISDFELTPLSPFFICKENTIKHFRFHHRTFFYCSAVLPGALCNLYILILKCQVEAAIGINKKSDSPFSEGGRGAWLT